MRGVLLSVRTGNLSSCESVLIAQRCCKRCFGVPGFPGGKQDFTLHHRPILFRLNNPTVVAVFFATLAFFCPCSGARADTRAGIWVEAEGRNRPFESAAGFRTFLDFAGEYPFSDLYCQVYRRGRAWFPSKLVDDSEYRSAREQGFDPLRDTINVAHRQGKRVHAWINALRIDRDMSSPALKLLGRGAVLTDNFGNSLLDYGPEGEAPGRLSKAHRLDTPGVWLDPSSPAVRQFVVKLVEELLDQYPELDGVHLDMIRFPFSISGRSLTFPYGKDSEARFRAETGKTAPRPGQNAGRSSSSLKEFDDWRRSQITRLVFEVQQEVKSHRPNIELTAAVVAAPDRSEWFTFQDWKLWIATGAIDSAIPMNYSRDPSIFRKHLRFAVTNVNPSRVRMGLGGWLFLDDPAGMAAQVAESREAGVREVTFFSYSNLLNPRGRDLLKRSFDQLRAGSTVKKLRLPGLKQPPTVGRQLRQPK